MRKRTLLSFFLWTLGTSLGMAQDDPAPAKDLDPFWLEPVELGVRLDDNVYRTEISAGRLSDVVYLIDLGGGVRLQKDDLKVKGAYRLSTDQYQVYSLLNNQKHWAGLTLSWEPDEVSFSYKYALLLRNSLSPDYDYLDQEHRFSFLWDPSGPWAYELRYARSSKGYFDPAVEYRSRDFNDHSFTLGAQREFGERFSLGLSGTCDLREFKRNAVDDLGLEKVPAVLHLDETWSLRLHARLFFASVLQDVVLEQQRTESNSYGFSNSARSLTWAAVVRPVNRIYLQLLGRVFWKGYDVPPLPSPDLQVGFVDEDSQEVLSVRTTWEWSSQWFLNLGVSRVRNESTQPGVFYIKDLFTIQIRREF